MRTKYTNVVFCPFPAATAIAGISFADRSAAEVLAKFRPSVNGFGQQTPQSRPCHCAYAPQRILHIVPHSQIKVLRKCWQSSSRKVEGGNSRQGSSGRRCSIAHAPNASRTWLQRRCGGANKVPLKCRCKGLACRRPKGVNVAACSQRFTPHAPLEYSQRIAAFAEDVPASSKHSSWRNLACSCHEVDEPSPCPDLSDPHASCCTKSVRIIIALQWLRL